MINKKGAGQMQFIIALICIGLFTIAILSFSGGFADDNGSAININNDPEINTLSSQTTGNVSQFKTESESTTSSIINSTIAPGSTTTTGSGQYGITATSSIGTATNILKIGFSKIFGSEIGFGIFITSFITIIGFISILYIVKLWRAGIPD